MRNAERSRSSATSSEALRKGDGKIMPEPLRQTFYGYILHISGKNNTMVIQGVKKINTVVLCIGTMRVTGDSVGPRVGDILKARGVNCFVYGDSTTNINAHKLDVYRNLIDVCHKADIIIAVDAALGEKADVGRVKITNNGLFPGRALGRKGKSLGDIGVLAVVGEKGGDNYSRLAGGDEKFIEELARKTADMTMRLIEYIENFSASPSAYNRARHIT